MKFLLEWLPPGQGAALCPSSIFQALFSPGSTKRLGKMSKEKIPCEASSPSHSDYRDFHINQRQLRDNALGLQALLFTDLLRGLCCQASLTVPSGGVEKGPQFLFSSLSACHLFLLFWKEACHTTMKSFSTLELLPASHFSLFKSIYTVSLAT